jgi:hypothetical protein
LGQSAQSRTRKPPTRGNLRPHEIIAVSMRTANQESMLVPLIVSLNILRTVSVVMIVPVPLAFEDFSSSDLTSSRRTRCCSSSSACVKVRSCRPVSSKICRRLVSAIRSRFQASSSSSPILRATVSAIPRPFGGEIVAGHARTVQRSASGGAGHDCGLGSGQTDRRCSRPPGLG